MATIANDVHGFQQRAYNPDNITIKKANVQERLTETVSALTACHEQLDHLENAVQPEVPGHPTMGLIGAAIACQETAERLRDRLSELRDQLGTL